MVITDNRTTERRRWRYVGIGMLIMISIFMLADGVGRIIRHRDLGWIVIFGGATALLMWITKVVRDQ